MLDDLPEDLRRNPLIEARYRPSACAIIIDDDGRILWCERVDFAESLQFPQGGIDEGESPEEAMWREVGEELGVEYPRSAFELVRAAKEPIRYDFPEDILRRSLDRGRRSRLGQEQHYFLLRLRADPAVMTLEPPDGCHREFRSVRWGGPELVKQVVAFKRPALEAGMRALGLVA